MKTKGDVQVWKREKNVEENYMNLARYNDRQ